ncbi:MAG: CDP-glycerol glycerophosphotransferase family protein [Lachnospiraceae bacterium]|nr:CDP-glycerol glycerophosphotransferase family protein [Lachnospiraceae bacterium]
MNIKYFLHFMVKVLLRTVLHVFWIFPVRQNRLFFINELSYTYGDSLKYINEYIREKRPGKYQVIFPVKDTAEEGSGKFIPVKPHSRLYYYYIMTSRVIISNAGGYSYLPLRKSQKVISTWHGGGAYKKVGGEVFKNRWSRLESKMNAGNLDYMLSSCLYFSKYECRSMDIPPRKCVPSGIPRVDIFFKDTGMIREKVFNYYGLNRDSHLVIYAPTYRSDMNDYVGGLYSSSGSELDSARVTAAFAQRFGGSWDLGIRLHPKLKDIAKPAEGCLDLTGYPDMQELLCAAGAVITDYSSLMWDAGFTGKPCFIFAPDIDQYEKERGFYVPVSEWPYIVAKSENELVSRILRFDESAYKDALKKHHEAIGSYEKGRACAIALKLIERS